MEDLTILNPIPPHGEPNFRAIVRFCEQHKSDLLAALPSMAGNLSYAFGFDGMLTLVREHGGERIYFPKEFNNDGNPFAASSSKLFNSYAITMRVSFKELERVIPLSIDAPMPSASGVMDIIKKVAALKAVERGESIRAIARAVGSHSRSIRRWKLEYGLSALVGGEDE